MFTVIAADMAAGAPIALDRPFEADPAGVGGGGGGGGGGSFYPAGLLAGRAHSSELCDFVSRCFWYPQMRSAPPLPA